MVILILFQTIGLNVIGSFESKKNKRCVLTPSETYGRRLLRSPFHVAYQIRAVLYYYPAD